MMFEEGKSKETHHINEVVDQDSSSINKASSSSKEEPNVNMVSKMDNLEVMAKKDEPPNVNIVSKMDNLEVMGKKDEQPNVYIVSKMDNLEVLAKKDDEPEKRQVVVEEVKKLEEEPKKGEKRQVVVEEVKKLEEEPKKGEVVVDEINKKKEDKESAIQQVLVVEEPEKKTNADVKEEKNVIEKFDTREVVEEKKKEEEQKCRDVEEKKLVLEEPQTKEVGKDKQLVEEPKIGGETSVEVGEPNKTDVVVEKKIDQEESKIGEEEPETGCEAIKQEVESDSSLLEKSSSFKEENKVGGGNDLKEHEKKALNELKSKIEEAILENKFLIKKKDEVVLDNEKLAPKPVEEEKVKSISQEEKTSTEVASEENATTTEVDKKEEKHTKEEEEVQEKNDQEKDEVEKQKEKCLPNGEDDKKSSNVSVEEKSMEIVSTERDISLWGVPLLPSKGSEATNVILVKFLRARDFKVNEAFEMLRNTIQWRKEFKIDTILDEDFGSELSSVAYMDGLDREGHPICYNMYGIFEDNELYQKTFGSEEKRQQFLRWRYQLMEKGIRKLDFNSGGVTSLLQINDLKNSPGPSKKELRTAMKQAVALLQDNYPEFVARNIFVNVPFWYYAFNAVLSPFLTQRTKSKFVFARPSKVTETLLRYIPAEQVPIRYGGLKRENDSEFITDEESVVTELAIKAGSTETIEIHASEVGTTVLWDLAVLGWEVNYKAEFVPNDEGSYTIIVQKVKKMGLNEEPIRNSFKSNEPGKIILSIENGTYKKKRAFYRFKTHN